MRLRAFAMKAGVLTLCVLWGDKNRMQVTLFGELEFCVALCVLLVVVSPLFGEMCSVGV